MSRGVLILAGCVSKNSRSWLRHNSEPVRSVRTHKTTLSALVDSHVYTYKLSHFQESVELFLHVIVSYALCIGNYLYGCSMFGGVDAMIKDAISDVVYTACCFISLMQTQEQVLHWLLLLHTTILFLALMFAEETPSTALQYQVSTEWQRMGNYIPKLFFVLNNHTLSHWCEAPEHGATRRRELTNAQHCVQVL